MSLKKFFKNYILEQDDNLVSISPDDYLELLDDVGGIAERISRLKPYRGKGIVITGDLNLSKYKNVGPLTGVVRVMGRLDISHTNVPNLNGITVDRYISDYGSSMWKVKMQAELNEKLAELDEKRQEGEWDVENEDDDSERTEALYKYLKQNGDVDMVEDEEGNEVPEDKYYIYPSGNATYGYGRQYEWLGGGNGFSPKTYDVYTEDEADDAAKVAVEQMLDDMGMESFSEWVFEGALDTQSWRSWLYDFYDDIIRDEPDNYDIPLELTQQQTRQVQQLQATLDSLNKRLETEELPDDQYEALELKIEGLEETIQEIKDDPQGDYDESLIENEINDRVNEYEDDIKSFIDHYDYDKDFIMDFIDTNDITNTVVNSDGYGSLLNSYDGDYDTFNIHGTEYYVMRVS
jgi:predicted  nucleic acid-binding Zn-ribbon protein